MEPLTDEIVKSDELFREWLWAPFYKALGQHFFEIIDAELDEYEKEVLYGTGDEQPIGILHGRKNPTR